LRRRGREFLHAFWASRSRAAAAAATVPDARNRRWLASAGARRCLLSWQKTLAGQGAHRRARTCELCCAEYFGGAAQRAALPWRARVLLAADRAAACVLDAAGARSLAHLLVKSWRAYLWASSLAWAGRWAWAGLRGGVLLGHALIVEQHTLLRRLLGTISQSLGAPLAELLWLQAVSALLFGFLSELVYASALGAVGGAALGFAAGYVRALQASAGLAAAAGRRVTGGAAWLGFSLHAVSLQLVRGASGAAAAGGRLLLSGKALRAGAGLGLLGLRRLRLLP
jgi:hypothetical protein